jgi:hypothetical protein
VNVYFNGELLGHTGELPHGPVLDWSSAAATAPSTSSGAAFMKLVVPRGQTLASCRLEVEVLALEHHHHIGLHTTTTTTATVLGARVITGTELEELAGIPQKATSPGDSPPGPRRVVGAGGATYFPLESSVRPPPATATKTGPAPAAAPVVVAPEPAPTGLLKVGLSFRSNKGASEKPKSRGAALDASAMAAAANAQNAATAGSQAHMPVNFTPQGELGLIIKPATAAGAVNGAVRAASTGLKNIVIEEPELVRENSIMVLNMLALQDLASAVLAAKETRPAEKTADAGEGARSVDVVIRWNGVTVEKFLAVLDAKTGALQLPHKPTVPLRLPFNLQITDCHLELLLWCGDILVGSAAYWGADLAQMCGVDGSVHADTDDAENEGGADGSTKGQAAIVTSGTPLWHSLRPSQTIPKDLQSPKISGRILLTATLTRPILQKKSIASSRDPNRKRTFFRVIRSDLTAGKKNWSYHYTSDDRPDDGDRSVDGAGDVDEADRITALPQREARPTQAPLQGSPDGPARKRLVSDMSLASSAPDTIPTATAGAGVLANLGAAAGATVDVGQVGLPDDRAKHQKLRLELSAVGFTVTVHQEIDEYRICWRGRVMPKNFQGSEGTRKAMMVSRASRLVRTHGINDMQVMAEIHQLQETGEDEDEVNDLPICVKEVLTDGPGLVQRTYRVEISANNGVMMGAADIKDNLVEFERVVGKEHVPRLLPTDRKLWKLGTIFQHVVRERVVLDMLVGKGTGKGKDGRREGLIQKHDELAELTGSIISVMRDPSPEEVAKAARAVRDAAEAEAAALKAAEDAAAAEQANSSKFGLNLGLNLKSFKFGFGKKAAAPVAAVAEEDSLVLETVNTNDTQRGSTAGAYSTHSHSVSGGENDDDDEARYISHKVGRVWLRIHVRTHRVVGKPLRSVVLLLATEATSPLYYTNQERYFKQVQGRACLLQFDVLFRCKNSFTKETRELFLTSADLDEWLPQSHVVDMTTRFRRDKLGAYLLQYLSIRFTEAGKIGLYLIKENVNVSSSIDDLIAEDEAQQEQREKDQN